MHLHLSHLGKHGVCSKCQDDCKRGRRADEPLPHRSLLHLCYNSIHLQCTMAVLLGLWHTCVLESLINLLSRI